MFTVDVKHQQLLHGLRYSLAVLGWMVVSCFGSFMSFSIIFHFSIIFQSEWDERVCVFESTKTGILGQCIAYRRCIVSLCLSLCQQDPVVQSNVSLTSSLRGQIVKCFTTL